LIGKIFFFLIFKNLKKKKEKNILIIFNLDKFFFFFYLDKERAMEEAMEKLKKWNFPLCDLGGDH
jgi:hypothetical protein